MYVYIHVHGPFGFCRDALEARRRAAQFDHHGCSPRGEDAAGVMVLWSAILAAERGYG